MLEESIAIIYVVEETELSTLKEHGRSHHLKIYNVFLRKHAEYALQLSKEDNRDGASLLSTFSVFFLYVEQQAWQ